MGNQSFRHHGPLTGFSFKLILVLEWIRVKPVIHFDDSLPIFFANTESFSNPRLNLILSVFRVHCGARGKNSPIHDM